MMNKAIPPTNLAEVLVSDPAYGVLMGGMYINGTVRASLVKYMCGQPETIMWVTAYTPLKAIALLDAAVTDAVLGGKRLKY